MAAVIVAFVCGISALVAVGVCVCVLVRRELEADLEHQRVSEHLALARMRMRRLHHDMQRQMRDAVIDVREP